MKKILFVCGHNSGRSQMAEVYFNLHNKNPEIEAISAGTGLKWNGKINPKVVNFLLSKNIDIHDQPKKYFPKEITTSMIQDAHIVCTMGCMDCDIVGNRKIDYDFWLDDPAEDTTNIATVFVDMQRQMEQFFSKK